MAKNTAPLVPATAANTAPPLDITPLSVDEKKNILTGKQEHCKFPPKHLFERKKNLVFFLPRSGALAVYSGNLWLTLPFADLKRELIGNQVKFEIAELNSPTALQRFGAPFGSPLGEVAPVDSELPILRYIFVHHVRKFPFLNQAKEKEFWQDKLQVVSFYSAFIIYYWGFWLVFTTIERF